VTGAIDTRDDAGVRKVQSLTRTASRSGDPSGTPSLPPKQAAAMGQDRTPVPGLTIIENFGSSPYGNDEPETATAVTPRAEVKNTARVPVAPPPPKSERPRIVVKKITGAAQSKQAAPNPPKPPRAPVVAKRAPAKERVRVASRTPVQTQSPSRGGGNGYVAVLSSKSSQLEALKAIADMQARYTTILRGKPADVRASDQSARGLGVVYRAVVGPASSRQEASAVCFKLKAAGYKGCWVTAN
jgi:hypothetical protein